MKEFMRRDSRQVFIRVHADCGRVRMLHAAATSSLANVKNKRVALERRSIHELQLVLADTFQIAFNLFLLPVIAVNHYPNRGLKPRQLKFFKFTCLDGSIDKGIVAGGITAEVSNCSTPFNHLNRRTGGVPLFGDVRHRKMHRFSAPVRDIQKNHRWIDESVLAIELRGERTYLIPIGM